MEAEVIDHDHLPGRLGPAFEHITDVHDARQPGGPVRRLRPRSGGRHHGVGCLTEQPLRGRGAPVLISTPLRWHSAARLRTTSRNSAREGKEAATATCPPVRGSVRAA